MPNKCRSAGWKWNVVVSVIVYSLLLGRCSGGPVYEFVNGAWIDVAAHDQNVFILVGDVMSLVPTDNNTILAGGLFELHANGQQTSDFASLDLSYTPAKWRPSPILPFSIVNIDGVNAIAYNGSTTYVAGRFAFECSNGVLCTSILKLNDSGYFPLGTGVQGEISTLFLHGNLLHVSGQFTRATPNALISNYDIWDATNGSWSLLRPTLSFVGTPTAFAYGAVSGRMFMANMADSASTQLYESVDDGWSWASAMVPFDGPVYAMAFSDDEKYLFVGGAFGEASGERISVISYTRVDSGPLHFFNLGLQSASPAVPMLVTDIVTDAGRMIVTGMIQSASGGIPLHSIFTINTTNGLLAFGQLGNGFTGVVKCAAVANGRIFAGVWQMAHPYPDDGWSISWLAFGAVLIGAVWTICTVTIIMRYRRFPDPAPVALSIFTIVMSVAVASVTQTRLGRTVTTALSLLDLSIIEASSVDFWGDLIATGLGFICALIVGWVGGLKRRRPSKAVLLAIGTGFGIVSDALQFGKGSVVYPYVAFACGGICEGIVYTIALVWLASQAPSPQTALSFLIFYTPSIAFAQFIEAVQVFLFREGLLLNDFYVSWLYVMLFRIPLLVAGIAVMLKPRETQDMVHKSHSAVVISVTVADDSESGVSEESSLVRYNQHKYALMWCTTPSRRVIAICMVLLSGVLWFLLDSLWNFANNGLHSTMDLAILDLSAFVATIVVAVLIGCAHGHYWKKPGIIMVAMLAVLDIAMVIVVGLFAYPVARGTQQLDPGTTITFIVAATLILSVCTVMFAVATATYFTTLPAVQTNRRSYVFWLGILVAVKFAADMLAYAAADSVQLTLWQCMWTSVGLLILLLVITIPVIRYRHVF